MKLKLFNQYTSVKELWIKTRYSNSLMHNNIFTIGQLIKFWNECGNWDEFKKRVCKLKNIGPEGAMEIHDILMKFTTHVFED